MPERVFVIDDEKEMIEVATHALEQGSYTVESSRSPRKALKKIRENPPDLILLDINMDEMNGLDVCREIKSDPKISHIPIVMVSVLSEEADVVVGLEMGADDYIAKPLRKRELLARIRNVIKRKGPEPAPQQLTHGPFKIDFGSYRAWMDDNPLELTPKEFELFGFFLKKSGQVLTRGRISETIWGSDFTKTSRTVDTHIDQLRRKLGKYRRWIQSLKGVGYRFEIE
jgi:DNA-binding response OmpR family regulator